MEAKEVRGELLAYARRSCKPFEKRLYLDISRLGECPRKLAWEMLYSGSPGEDIKLRLFVAQLMESNLVSRLVKLFGSTYVLPKPIYAMMGKLLGYTSGEFGKILVTIKSIPNDDALPDGRASNNHYWMTQALMHFGHYTRCIIIYESRASGRIRTYDITYSPSIGEECEKKAVLILDSVNEGQLPKCNCGRCKENGYIERER